MHKYDDLLLGWAVDSCPFVARSVIESCRTPRVSAAKQNAVNVLQTLPRAAKSLSSVPTQLCSVLMTNPLTQLLKEANFKWNPLTNPLLLLLNPLTNPLLLLLNPLTNPLLLLLDRLTNPLL